MQVEVAIVGAGLAGLSCARRLTELGVSCAVFEAANRVGGRVATDEVDGFLLDRGFQVLLDSYPEAKRALDLTAMGCRAFAPGALVRHSGRFWRIVDPWRAPMRGLATLRAPFVSLRDGTRMASLRGRALKQSAKRDGRSTEELLRDIGFSASLRESFFRPFFGGVTLDATLATPAWYFLALFGWFARGNAVLPARGMRAIPEALAAALPGSSLHFTEAVEVAAPGSLMLARGRRVSCRAVVLATDAASAARLLGSREEPKWLGTTTLYYGAERSPVGEPILVLDGEGGADRGRGPVNHLCVLSDAQPTYAPPGSALISVSVLGVPPAPDSALDADVRAQLRGWYGSVVGNWKLLRVDRIERALPRLCTPAQGGSGGLQRPDPKDIFVCGDHVATPSIQGALESGRLTAERVRIALGPA